MSTRLQSNQEYPCKGPHYLTVLLGEKVAAMLIGKGGSVISELEMQTNASIKLAPAGTHYPTTQDRTTVVGCGSVAGVKEVVRQCLRLQREFGTPPVHMRLVAPVAACPLIIGRGGEIIRSLCSSFGVNIKIQERVEGMGERIVDVRGPHDAEIVEAIMAVQEMINKETNPAEYASVLYPYHSGNFRVEENTVAARREVTTSTVRTAQAPSIEVLSHPSKIAFLVPEKCRLTLKECAVIEKQLEGVKIALSPKDEFDCNVDIEGPLASVQAAHILLIKLVTDRLLQDQNIVLSR